MPQTELFFILQAIKATNPDLQGDDDQSDLEPDDSGISSEEDEASDANEEEEGEEDPDREDDEDDEEDGMSLAEGSDAEDLIGLDDDMPDGLVEYPASEGGDEDEEWGGIEDGNKKKRKGRHEDSKQKKKKLRSLPTFASYDDYAKMIEDGPEDDI